MERRTSSCRCLVDTDLTVYLTPNLKNTNAKYSDSPENKRMFYFASKTHFLC